MIRYLSLLMLLLGGCISINPCPYCGERKYPDYIKYTEKDMGDEITKNVKWYGWIHYSKRIPQPDKNIEMME